MKQNKEKLSKIIDEILTYLFSIGATDISVRVQEKEKEFIVHIQSDFALGHEKKIKQMSKFLNVPRQRDMEEYYWNLTGTSHVGKELFVVGIMIDRVEISTEGQQLEIYLYRQK
ncbi:MAG: hypothetical protein GX962_07325 [Epulopiscium sp.]|nr:hypothetical protein [Candidatus Epulonipiscium sp.]